MTGIPRLTLVILASLFGTTIVFGWFGWWQVYRDSPDHGALDALYHTLLALTGDGSYIESSNGPKLNPWIETARFTGLLTTISAIFGVLALFLKEQIKRFLASRRKGHFVIVGASDFVLDVFKSETITLFDVAETIKDPRNLPGKTIFIPGPITKSTGTRAVMGAPKAVVFGDGDTILNVERAQTWLAEMDAAKRTIPELILRVEDGSVARDLQLLSDKFRSARLVSRSETVARALLTSMMPTELAIRRGQTRPHIALVGLGSINLAIAEEAALRCHNFNLDPLRLTIVDVDVDRARKRIRQERPDLLAFGDGEVQVDFVSLDALECCSAGQADRLLAIEAENPLTAIVVATGDDTRNTAIAMRLRQLQVEQLRLRAPIYMRSDSLNSVSAAALTDLTGGILAFGGSALDTEDLELERLHHDLAEVIHNRWRDNPSVTKTEENDWKNMSIIDRRASYRAALSAVEMFYAAGFAPPIGHRLADLRLESSAGNTALGDEDLIRRMSRMEHDRWITERTLEGYRGTKQYRDNEKKLHPLIRPFLLLPTGEEVKDEKNVKESIHLGLTQREAAPKAPCWRRLKRVGLIGPLHVDDAATKLSIDTVLDQLCLDVPDFEEAGLEILTPNAPGFDRRAAIALADAWLAKTGRPARLLLMNAASAGMMDKIATEYLAREDKPHGPALKDQSKTLFALADKGHHVASMDCRPLATSDADLEADQQTYFEVVKSVQRSIMALADHMIFDHEDQAEWTEAAMMHWASLEKSKPYVV